jgi:tryptophan-rich sensory protein
VTSPTPLWKPLTVALAAAALVAWLGASLTDLGPWYEELRKPAWKPPDWLFGPAWTLIFTLTAVAGAQAWRLVPDRAGRTRIVVLFAANGVLNVLWSVLFFRLQRPDWALLEVPLLWLSVLALMITLGAHSRALAWMLLPYLVWVSFAAAVNAAVVQMNGA